MRDAMRFWVEIGMICLLWASLGLSAVEWWFSLTILGLACLARRANPVWSAHDPRDWAIIVVSCQLAKWVAKDRFDQLESATGVAGLSWMLRFATGAMIAAPFSYKSPETNVPVAVTIARRWGAAVVRRVPTCAVLDLYSSWLACRDACWRRVAWWRLAMSWAPALRTPQGRFWVIPDKDGQCRTVAWFYTCFPEPTIADWARHFPGGRAPPHMLCREDGTIIGVQVLYGMTPPLVQIEPINPRHIERIRSCMFGGLHPAVLFAAADLSAGPPRDKAGN